MGQLVLGGGEEPRFPATLIATRLTGAWLRSRTVRPPDVYVAKQAVAAKRLAENCTIEQLALALKGIEYLYPHSAGEPWDLFDLERKLVKAIEAGARLMEGEAPDLRDAQTRRELYRHFQPGEEGE